jgi:hypothetical protein
MIDNVEVELTNAIAGTAMNPAVTVLSQSISNPPTQAQVQAIQNKLNELINAITRPQVESDVAAAGTAALPQNLYCKFAGASSSSRHCPRVKHKN